MSQVNSIRFLKAAFLSIIFFVSTVTTIYLLLRDTLYVEMHRYHLEFIQRTKEANTKYILYWTPEFDSKIWRFPTGGSELFRTCEYTNCFATYDRHIRPIDTYSAILFFTSTTEPNLDIPSKRDPKQVYIFANSETPARFPAGSSQYVFNNFYNWTMTYRFDSDIVRRQGRVVKGGNVVIVGENFVRQKTKSVAWLVSNCYSSSKRVLLAKRLQKHIDVDIYGSCGNMSCSRSNRCYEMLERKYRYYLSFENAYCKDYTTEKFFGILSRNIIPIVYGGGDYKKIAPPNSYINVEDFKTVRELAEYLKELARNTTRYLQYFEWKKTYKVDLSTVKTACQLCKLLNDRNVKPKTYKDIKTWWYGAENSQCKIGKQLPNIIL